MTGLSDGRGQLPHQHTVSQHKTDKGQQTVDDQLHVHKHVHDKLNVLFVLHQTAIRRIHAGIKQFKAVQVVGVEAS